MTDLTLDWSPLVKYRWSHQWEKRAKACLAGENALRLWSGDKELSWPEFRGALDRLAGVPKRPDPTEAEQAIAELYWMEYGRCKDERLTGTERACYERDRRSLAAKRVARRTNMKSTVCLLETVARVDRWRRANGEKAFEECIPAMAKARSATVGEGPPDVDRPSTAGTGQDKAA